MAMRVAILLVLLPLCSATSHVGGIRRPDLSPLLSRGLKIAPQLQPEGYDNFIHNMPHFFNHELIFVESDMVLIWKPETGEWSLHELDRTCGADCPIITEKPVRSGIWPERAYHKLISLGCHATTGHGHILEIDPASGNYSINLFQHTQVDPMSARMATHRRLEMTQFHIAYAGKDEIIMYDGQTDVYKIYLVEPKLPMYADEDPIGPFEPLDQGNFSLHEQLVYMGNGFVMDYSAATGEYIVYSYDRGATLYEVPFTRVISRGHLDKDLVLTYLGERMVVALNPTTGKFKAFNMTEAMDVSGRQGLNREGIYFGFGSVLTGDICYESNACGNCIARPGCGWCETNQLCYRGSLNGPCTTNCTTWDLSICPGEPCHLHRGCTKCLEDPFCGWCADSQTCTEGTHAGPLFGSCEYSKTVCPIYAPPKEVLEERCTEEIE
jgi:hypothetical protein